MEQIVPAFKHYATIYQWNGHPSDACWAKPGVITGELGKHFCYPEQLYHL